MADGDYRDAQEAARRIQQLSDEYWHTLDMSCTALEDDAWIGPTGRRFADDVHTERRKLQIELAAAVRSARAKLQSLPKNP
jgi:hypothetical protein